MKKNYKYAKDLFLPVDIYGVDQKCNIFIRNVAFFYL